MAVNDFNSNRVDLKDIYRECEKRTSFHSRVYQGDELNQSIVISADDYDQLFRFSDEAANLIANHANYITCSTQTGLEALTADFTEQDPNPHDTVALEDLDERQKQTGELLDKGEMDILEFNIPELDNLKEDEKIKRYNIVKGFIRSAILEYILYKWYSMTRVNDEAQKSLQEHEKFKDLVRFNSVTNRKRVKKTRSYRAY